MIRNLCLVSFAVLILYHFAQASEVVPQSEIKAPVPLQAEGIQNFFQLSDRIYSGSAPEGDAGFASLQRLGVKTVITVDGTKPDVELAHKHGMHYVHLPHGYNGINTMTQAELIKAAETVPGPIFVHCHHGQHRGPTAAAVICMATAGWSNAKAEAWLKTAGTATNYTGLFKTVRDFHQPSPALLKNLPTHFPEVANLPGLVDTMVAIDGQWDHLKAIRKAGYRAPLDQPDLDPPNEAIILSEHFREAQRLKVATDRGDAFLEKLKSAESRAKSLERLLRRAQTDNSTAIRAQLDKSTDAVGQSCAACHKVYRDPAPVH